jgi:SagB-type dehydrogenase family enzyme
MKNRQLAWAVSFFGLVFFAVFPGFAGADIALEKPRASLGVDIMKALQMRKSTKSYITKEISSEALSNILWASHGVNRENGKRTAPTAYGKYYMDLYVVSSKGVHLYDPDKHTLGLISNEDVKTLIAMQKYVGEASHIIVMVADLTRFHQLIKEPFKLPAAYATAGGISQNIYLTAGAMGLGTCFVVSMKVDVIKDKLRLEEHQVPIVIMPLGYPK